MGIGDDDGEWQQHQEQQQKKTTKAKAKNSINDNDDKSDRCYYARGRTLPRQAVQHTTEVHCIA